MTAATQPRNDPGPAGARRSPATRRVPAGFAAGTALPRGLSHGLRCAARGAMSAPVRLPIRAPIRAPVRLPAHPATPPRPRVPHPVRAIRVRPAAGPVHQPVRGRAPRVPAA